MKYYIKEIYRDRIAKLLEEYQEDTVCSRPDLKGMIWMDDQGYINVNNTLATLDVEAYEHYIGQFDMAITPLIPHYDHSFYGKWMRIVQATQQGIHLVD